MAPRFSYRGTKVVRLCCRPVVSAVLKRRPRPVKRHIWRGFRTVNGFFQETCTGTEFRAFAGVFGRPDAKNQAIWHRTVILSLPRSSRIE
jgi:hypothetical protein